MSIGNLMIDFLVEERSLFPFDGDDEKEALDDRFSC